jgi:serine/threonine protein kinase
VNIGARALSYLHQLAVRYHQAWMEDNRLYIQTELCSANLADEIRTSGGRLSSERRFKLLREILLALEFIHRKGNGMCHLDIKPENIFVKKDPPASDVFKLGDFGLVTKISYHKDVEEGDQRYLSLVRKWMLQHLFWLFLFSSLSNTTDHPFYCWVL